MNRQTGKYISATQSSVSVYNETYVKYISNSSCFLFFSQKSFKVFDIILFYRCVGILQIILITEYFKYRFV